MFFETIIYFLFLLFTLVSICGYGLLYQYNEKKQLDTPYINIFKGLTILVPISFILNLITNNSFINLLLFIFGIFLFLIRYKKKHILNIFLLCLLFFSGLIISKTHEDFSVYHFQHINEISENYIILGLSNLDIRYTYSSIFSYLQSLYKFPILEFKTIFLPVYAVYISLIGYLLFNIKKKKKILISLFFLILLIVKFKRFSEFGYDYIGQFLLIFIFIEYIFDQKKNDKRLFDLISLFLLTILIKITNIYFLPVILIYIFNFKKSFNLKYFYTASIPVLTFLIVFCVNSYIKTGCFNYLFKITCDTQNKISWSVNYNEIESIKANSKSWARGYFHQNTKDKIEKENIYNKNFNWISNWTTSHFKLKILDFLLLLLIIYFLVKYFCTSKEKKFFSKKYVLLSGSLILSCLFWLYNFPQFRLGFASISIFSFLIIDYFYKSEVKLKKKQFIYLLIISILYFNTSNIYRISGEFSRDDIYKFKNFPFYPNPNLSFDTKQSGKIKYRVSKSNLNFWRTCWNIKPICVNHDQDIKITKINKRLFIEKVN